MSHRVSRPPFRLRRSSAHNSECLVLNSGHRGVYEESRLDYLWRAGPDEHTERVRLYAVESTGRRGVYVDFDWHSGVEGVLGTTDVNDDDGGV